MDSDRERLLERIKVTLEEATMDQLLLVVRFAENIVR